MSDVKWHPTWHASRRKPAGYFDGVEHGIHTLQTVSALCSVTEISVGTHIAFSDDIVHAYSTLIAGPRRAHTEKIQNVL